MGMAVTMAAVIMSVMTVTGMVTVCCLVTAGV